MESPRVPTRWLADRNQQARRGAAFHLGFPLGPDQERALPWASHGIKRMQTGTLSMRRRAMEETLSAFGNIYADSTKVLRVRDEGRDPDSAATNHLTRGGRITNPWQWCTPL